MKIISLGFCTALALLSACNSEDTRVAGGTSSTGNARILGVIVDSAGLPVKDCEVRLIPPDYNPLLNSHSVLPLTLTDSVGHYEFSQAPVSLYNLETYQAQTNLRGLHPIDARDNSKTIIARDTALPSGSLLFALDPVEYQVGDSLFLPGTTRIKEVTALALVQKRLTWDSLAPGKVSKVISKGKSKSLTTLISNETQIPAGDSTVAPSKLPSPWLAASIGEKMIQGGAAFGSGRFSIAGGGPDIWGKADGFQFVYQSLEANGEVTAMIRSLDFTSTYAKAGLMFRESIQPGSANICFSLEPQQNNNGVIFHFGKLHYRAKTSDSTLAVSDTIPKDSIPLPSREPPVYLRLKRTGDLFEAFISADGQSWHAYSKATLKLNAKLLVGMAVTSHRNGKVTVATYDSAMVKP